MNLKEEKTNIIQKNRCVLLWTYFEQLHSRHLVRSLTGSCTAWGCLQEHSGLHIVTSNPFLSVQQGVKKGLFIAWLASSWGRPGLFLLAFETCRHSRHTCNRPRDIIKVNIVAAKIHLWAGCLPKSPVLQLYQFVLSIQVVAKAARKSPKSLTEMLIRSLCKSAFSYLEHSYFLLSFHKVT